MSEESRLHKTTAHAVLRVGIGFVLTILTCVELLGGCALPSQHSRAMALLGTDRRAAWDMITVERSAPSVSGQEDLCELHAVYLSIAAETHADGFAGPDTERLIQESHTYVTDQCTAYPKKIVIADIQWGRYLHATDRPGLAIVEFQRALERAPGHSFEAFTLENNIALCYAAMGRTTLRDDHLARALDLGRAYFANPDTTLPPMNQFFEWNTYRVVLENKMLYLLEDPDPPSKVAELESLWSTIAPIIAVWHAPLARLASHVTASQKFAGAGATGRATELRDQARALYDEIPPGQPRALADVLLMAAEGAIEESRGNFERTALLLNQVNEEGEKLGLEIGSIERCNVGRANERAGNIDTAIDQLETALIGIEQSRSSFDVRQRGQVFNAVGNCYWAAIRANASRYRTRRDPTDFANAVRVAQMMRARQFGELLGLERSREISKDHLPLRPDELVLEYVVTERGIVLFAFGEHTQDIHLLDVDKKKLLALVTAARAGLVDPAAPGLESALMELGRTMFEPVWKPLAAAKRLIIIPDGALNGVPPAVLPNNPDRYVALVRSHTITLAPSLSHLVAKRAEPAHDKRGRVLAVGDPAFGDREVPPAYQGASRGFYTKAVDHFGLFAPLPGTRVEVENLSAALGAGRVDMLLGNDARESAIKSRALTDYDLLHFATHGVLGNQIPGLYQPALVLSPEPGEDGFLTLSEVENLKLNSSLTILSACDTGRGEFYAGEGVMGLARGFLVAGSDAVVVSLWPVASEPTTRLMTAFYTLLESGSSKADALRRAQLMMMDVEHEADGGRRGFASRPSGARSTAPSATAHPYFWSPFVLIGE